MGNVASTPRQRQPQSPQPPRHVPSRRAAAPAPAPRRTKGVVSAFAPGAGRVPRAPQPAAAASVSPAPGAAPVTAAANAPIGARRPAGAVPSLPPELWLATLQHLRPEAAPAMPTWSAVRQTCRTFAACADVLWPAWQAQAASTLARRHLADGADAWLQAGAALLGQTTDLTLDGRHVYAAAPDVGDVAATSGVASVIGEAPATRLAAIFAATPQLRRLTLRRGCAGGVLLQLPWSLVPQLHVLKLEDNLVRAEHVARLPAALLARLTVLHVTRNFLCSGEAPVPVAAMGQLRELNLADNLLSGWPQGGAAANAALVPSRTSPLERLELAHNRLGAIGLASLPWARWSALTHLNLADNPLLGAGVAALPWPQLRGLRVLDLSRCSLGNEGARALPLPTLTNLVDLALADNELDGEGVRQLRLADCRVPMRLDVRGNQVKLVDLPPAWRVLSQGALEVA